MTRERLFDRIHDSPLLWDLCKAIHYVGFPFRELAERMKPFIAEHGASRVSGALKEIAEHAGWRTMLSPSARKACSAVLGPAPEQWDSFYTDAFGNPTPRPSQHQSPPVIPPPKPDLFLDSLPGLSNSMLEAKLNRARSCKEASEVQAIESEMVRRGMDVPKEEAGTPLPATGTVKVKTARKKVK